ncbi:MAG: 16S rRNA (guanine(966)-N(2))-methyltransferase RsmD [Clostridia bacterium]|nr:16S rRNA (guanine(966)-N(2))-methyltransferase RsmD [Clostridia bacterium]
MRIVAGKYRGKKLKEFDLDSTRPTTDRVKESIFNLIQFDVVDAVVLDLFSGTGALGIEAISRGAKKTYMIDQNIKAINIIKDNLKEIQGDFVVKHIDAIEFLKQSEKFDIVLIDPPYKTDLGVKAIDIIINQNKLNENGIIIFETSAELYFDFDYEGFDITKRKYGTVMVYKFVKQ